MKRCCILVLYDKDGIFDKYVFNLIRELKTISHHLVIVINGEVQKNSFEKLKTHCNHIIIRENYGFDAAAYRQVILSDLFKNNLQKFDEIVFCNDTFFGPFVSMKEIFNTMQLKQCDFWGIGLMDFGFLSLVQSFFLVFKNKILKNNELYNYFKSIEHTQIEEYYDAVVHFEKGLYDFLCRKNYIPGAYMDQMKYDPCRQDDLLLNIGYPILKRRAFTRNFYSKQKALNSLKQIAKQNYNTDFIIENIKRVLDVTILNEELKKHKIHKTTFDYNEQPRLLTTAQNILDFQNKYKKIYIYGAGGFAKMLIFSLNNKLSNLDGFVVSDGQKTDEVYIGKPVFNISEIKDKKDLGILVALWHINSNQVKKTIGSDQNILYLWE